MSSFGGHLEGRLEGYFGYWNLYWFDFQNYLLPLLSVPQYSLTPTRYSFFCLLNTN